MKPILSMTLIAVMAAASSPGSAQAFRSGTDLEILRSFAKDYESDLFFKDAATFGVNVGGDFYTIDARPASESNSASVSVRTGKPEAPTFLFVIENSEILQKLDVGKVHALTLAGKATSADYAPLDLDVMEGFAPPEWFSKKITRLLFHFWTKGTPEIVPFAAQETRVVHGSNLGAFYYQPGFRSAWFDIRPDQHVNEGEEDTSNPFPSMFIILKGELRAIIGGEDFTFGEGNMMLVPAGVQHEFVNESDANAFGILLMFGEGA